MKLTFIILFVVLLLCVEDGATKRNKNNRFKASRKTGSNKGYRRVNAGRRSGFNKGYNRGNYGRRTGYSRSRNIGSTVIDALDTAARVGGTLGQIGLGLNNNVGNRVSGNCPTLCSTDCQECTTCDPVCSTDCDQCNWAERKKRNSNVDGLPCQFESWDTDNDGSISLSELASAGKASTADKNTVDVFAKVDTDGDGKLSEAELDGAPLVGNTC